MSSYKFKSNVSTDGINNLIAELQNYAHVTLADKCTLFTEKLAQRGVVVAYQNTHPEFVDSVEYSYTISGVGETEFYGQTTRFINRVWYDKKGNEKGGYSISPMQMLEFGAGKNADSNPWGIGGMRGSLGKNGLRDEWFWFDENGTRHSSESDPTIQPTRPIYNAFVKMLEICDEVSREVFNT